MSFDRYRSQVFCESLFGCSSYDDFRLKNYSEVEGLSLDTTAAFTLSNALKSDAKDLYYKGCQTLVECLSGFNDRNYSWAIVKAYYATFYFLKADFALKDYALIRHKCIYYLKADNGAQPQTKGRTGNSRTDYSGDHKSAINYYSELFSHSDILLSQEIDGLNAYHWLMKKREQVNYQERNFREPLFPDFLDFINERIGSIGLKALIETIINDTGYILTFQSDYAPLAIPIKRTLLTKQSFLDNGINPILDEQRTNHIETFGYSFH